MTERIQPAENSNEKKRSRKDKLKKVGGIALVGCVLFVASEIIRVGDREGGRVGCTSISAQSGDTSYKIVEEGIEAINKENDEFSIEKNGGRKIPQIRLSPQRIQEASNGIDLSRITPGVIADVCAYNATVFQISDGVNDEPYAEAHITNR